MEKEKEKKNGKRENASNLFLVLVCWLEGRGARCLCGPAVWKKV